MDQINYCLKSENPGLELLVYYQGDGSKTINNLFRKRDCNLTAFERIVKIKVERYLNSYLQSSPIISTYTEKIVYRVDQNFNKEWGIKNINKIICFPGYLSTYRSHRECKGMDVIKIKTLAKKTNAYDILGINESHPEKEILFKSSTRFKISMSKNEIILVETIKQPQLILYQDAEFYFNETTIYKNKSLSDMDEI